MEDQFSAWKDILDDSNEGDGAIPAFNKDTVWNKVQPRIKEEKKTPIIWWRYAAAVLILGAITGGALKLWNSDTAGIGNNVAVQEPTVQSSQLQQQQLITIAPQQVVVAKEDSKKASRTNIHTIDPVIVKTQDVLPRQTSVTPLPEPTIEPPVAVVEPETPEQPIAVKPLPKAKVQVVHLLDIPNEDINSITQKGNEEPRRPFRLLSPRSNGNDNRLPATIVNNYIRNNQ